MKIKINSDDDLSLKKTLKLLIAVRSIFQEGNKYYTIKMLKYDKIDVSAGHVDIDKIIVFNKVC